MENVNWVDEPRTTVKCVTDPSTGSMRLVGTETCDQDRANVFGKLREEEPDEDPDYDYEGRYFAAQTPDPVSIEVEVRFSFFDCDDIDDHAEAYWFQVYNWDLVGETAVCTKDEYWHGDYLVEVGGLVGPAAIVSPLVTAAVSRIRDVRWNKVMTPSRIIGA